MELIVKYIVMNLLGLMELHILSNIATFTLVNDNNCDSILTLDLTINQSTSSYDTVIVCDSYEWNDTTYFESGNYVYISTNVNGCDSLANLDLTISQIELLSINE